MINKAVPTTISFIPMLVYLDEAAPRHQRSTDLVELQAMQPPEMQTQRNVWPTKV